MALTGSGREPHLRIRKAGDAWSAQGQAKFTFGQSVSPYFPSKGRAAAAWSWDGTKLDVRNDRHGLVPLYYTDHGGEVSISTSIPQLLALGAPADFDYPAIAVFLRMGSYLGSDTAFRAIRALPPNSKLRWSAGKLKLTSATPVAAVNNLSREAALDGFIELFRQSIRRRSPLHSEFAVPLTGGHESRHILFELCGQGHRPKLCVTARHFPFADDREVKAASSIAAAVGVPLRIADLPGSRLAAERRSHTQTNFCSLDAACGSSVADALRGQVELIYDDIGGNELSAGLFLTPQRLQLFRARRFGDLAEGFLEYDAEAPIYAESARGLLQRSVAVDRCARELEQHADAPNPVGSFVFRNRTRRHNAANGYWMLAKAGTVITPYLDDDLFDFLSGLPAEMFLDHTFHTDAIRLAYPQYAAQTALPVVAETRRRNDAALRKFAGEIIRCGLSHGRTRLVRRRYFLPRVLRCIVDSGYQSSINWLGPSLLYLLDLERAADLSPVAAA